MEQKVLQMIEMVAIKMFSLMYVNIHFFSTLIDIA